MLHEPLLTAAKLAAQAMQQGAKRATCGRGGRRQNYGEMLAAHRDDVLKTIVEEVILFSGGRQTVRELAQGVLLDVLPIGGTTLHLVVCDSSRPEGEVEVLRSVDGCYVLSADAGLSIGLSLTKQR
jgi:hypothetical protein